MLESSTQVVLAGVGASPPPPPLQADKQAKMRISGKYFKRLRTTCPLHRIIILIHVLKNRHISIKYTKHENTVAIYCISNQRYAVLDYLYIQLFSMCAVLV